MSRITRRNWTSQDMGLKGSGGLTDLFDNAVKGGLRINDAEYDLLCEKLSDEEMEFLIPTSGTGFTQRRRIIEILNRYIKYD